MRTRILALQFVALSATLLGCAEHGVEPTIPAADRVEVILVGKSDSMYAYSCAWRPHSVEFHNFSWHTIRVTRVDATLAHVGKGPKTVGDPNYVRPAGVKQSISINVEVGPYARTWVSLAGRNSGLQGCHQTEPARVGEAE
jgi:hypothetical protein